MPPIGRGSHYRAAVDTTTEELWAAVEDFDTEAAEVAIARLLWDVPLSGAVVGVVLPFLHEVGERWESGTLSVAHEHFVSDMLRRKLSALSAVPPQQVLDDAADGSASTCWGGTDESADSLRRSMSLTKCSWATDRVPDSHRSPTSWRKGSTTPTTAPESGTSHRSLAIATSADSASKVSTAAQSSSLVVVSTRER